MASPRAHGVEVAVTGHIATCSFVDGKPPIVTEAAAECDETARCNKGFTMSITSIPEGYHSVTAYLIVSRAADAIDFYRRAFGAEELLRLEGPGGSVMHAEVRVGDSPIMLSDANPEWGTCGPEGMDSVPVSLMLYVDDVDAVFLRALEAGASLVREVSDQFYGDRMGQIRDPFGHLWSIATHVEDVSPQELQRRMDSMMATPD